MNTQTVKLLSLVTGILGMAAILVLITDYVFYSSLEPIMNPDAKLEDLKFMGGFIWLSYISLFFYHILAVGTLVYQLRFFRRIKPISILAISAGVISFIGVFSEGAVFGDITKEYTMGWDISGEWTILRLISGIHAIFLLTVTGVCAGVVFHLRSKQQDILPESRDEIVFVVAQYVGIVCGLIGMAWIAMAIIMGNISGGSVYHSISASLMILFPYGLIVFYWLILKLNNHFFSLYDEKQWRDVTKAGFTTLILMIPVMLFLFLITTLDDKNFSNQLIWFPMFLFSTLLLFSLLTLFNYRRA